MNIIRSGLATVGLVLACGVAQAGNISWSIGISLPPIGTVISNAPDYADGPYYGGVPYHRAPPAVYQPAPVYHAPPPVVYRPAPIYHAPPPVIYRPAPIYYSPPPAVVYGPPPRYHRPPHHHHGHRGWREGRWERIDHGEHRHGRGEYRRGRD